MSLIDTVQIGATDRSVTVTIVTAADGVPNQSVVYNTSGLALWYRREGAAKVAITTATLAALTTAHADGGFLHVDDGVYRLDLPDAAIASGAKYVDIGGALTDNIVFGGRVRLVNYNPEDSVRLGLTALPTAATGTEGGIADYALLLYCAQQLAVLLEESAATLEDTNELQTDLTNDGRLDLLIDAIKLAADNALKADTSYDITTANGTVPTTFAT